MSQKRPRRTRAELQTLMLAAGKDVLFQIEPTLGFEQLTYSAVFEHLQTEYDQRVTIGSVHERIWKSQRDFQLDVVAAALRDPLPAVPDGALERAVAVLEAADLTTPAARRYALQTAVRLSSRHSNGSGDSRYEQATNLAHTVRFRLWALGPDHLEAAGFTEAITQIRQASTAGYVHVIRMLMKHLELRVQPSAGEPDEVMETIALLGNAATVGLLTDVLDSARRPRMIPSGPNGELEEWFLDSIALWASVQSMFELDGDGLTDDERRL